jgi:hypothetical protein
MQAYPLVAAFFSAMSLHVLRTKLLSLSAFCDGHHVLGERPRTEIR